MNIFIIQITYWNARFITDTILSQIIMESQETGGNHFNFQGFQLTLGQRNTNKT